MMTNKGDGVAIARVDLLLADLDEAHALCFDRGSEAAADKILDIMDAIHDQSRYHAAKGITSAEDLT